MTVDAGCGSAAWFDQCEDVELRPAELDERATVDGALFHHYLELRGRARGPVACVNSRFLFLNTAGSRLVAPKDRDVLWSWAQACLDSSDRAQMPFPFAGLGVGGTCEPIWDDHDGVTIVGAEIRMSPVDLGGIGEAPIVRGRVPFGWESLRDSELAIARLVADGLTNREVGACLYLSRHTIDFHLRQIYRKLGITSRVELTRLVLEHH